MAAVTVTACMLCMLTLSSFHGVPASKNLKTMMTVHSVITNPSYPVSKTTDGIYGPFDNRGCMASHGYTTVWWKGTFAGNTARIQKIDIEFRLSGRAHGFALWISNGTGIPSGDKFYQDPTNGTTALIQNITSDVTGQSVMIIIKRSTASAYMDVCEVDVYGCFLYRYGNQCQHICYCKHGCNPDNGDCDTQDCQAGWYGPRCTKECTYQTFGENCLQTCHCKNSGCDRHTGQCTTQGCVAGYMGDSCSTECAYQKFEENCLQTCHCKNSGCDRKTGQCTTEGCVTGFMGESCSTVCGYQTFGENCLQTCHCKNSGCDPQTGQCATQGCVAGYMGLKCNAQCNGTTFGDDCLITCHCNTPGCHHVTGTCNKPGCAAGWKAVSCNTSCATGEFGKDCLQRCHCAVGGCDVAVGTCTSPDCQDGWNGTSCSKECGSPFFGNKCGSQCNCKILGCNHVNGICATPGCLAGWNGGSCTSPCTKRTFGEDCLQTCHCMIPGCDLHTGQCTTPGCEAGYMGASCSTACTYQTFGENCLQTCHCKNSGCDRQTGQCTTEGCEAGYMGESCSTAWAALSVTCGTGTPPAVCDDPTTTTCTEGTTPGTMVCRCNHGYFDSNGYSTTGGMCTPMNNLKVTEVKSSGAIGSSSVTIAWTPPSDSSQISSYSVVWRIIGSADVTGSFYAGKSESATITGLTPGTSYIFTVKSTETGSRASPQEVESNSHVTFKYDAPTCTCTSTTPWIAACASTTLLAVLLAIFTAFVWNRSRNSTTGKHKEESQYATPERGYTNTDMHLYALTTDDNQQAARTGTADEDYSNIDLYNTAS